MQNHAKLGGILTIVAGAFGAFWLLLGLLFIYIGFFNYPEINYYNGYSGPYLGDFTYFWIIFIGWSLILTLLGIFAIIGGIFGIRRKVWGLALAGAIAGLLVFFPCGVVAIIFTALGKPEFAAQTQSAPAVMPT